MQIRSQSELTSKTKENRPASPTRSFFNLPCSPFCSQNDSDGKYRNKSQNQFACSISNHRYQLEYNLPSFSYDSVVVYVRNVNNESYTVSELIAL